MKTADEILNGKTELVYINGIEIEVVIYNDAVSAMKEYACKAIDAMISDYERGDDFDIKVYAEKTKDELK